MQRSAIGIQLGKLAMSLLGFDAEVQNQTLEAPGDLRVPLGPVMESRLGAELVGNSIVLEQ